MYLSQDRTRIRIASIGTFLLRGRSGGVPIEVCIHSLSVARTLKYSAVATKEDGDTVLHGTDRVAAANTSASIYVARTLNSCCNSFTVSMFRPQFSVSNEYVTDTDSHRVSKGADPVAVAAVSILGSSI